MKSHCKSHKNEEKKLSKNNFGFMGGLILSLIPKCPFCIMAYSSTVVLCSKDTFIESQSYHYSTLSLLLTTLFCAIIVASFLFNYRGNRTKYALALSIFGILMILYSIIRSGGQELYYSGVSIVFISVWLNGSLISILRKINIAFRSTVKSTKSSPYS